MPTGRSEAPLACVRYITYLGTENRNIELLASGTTVGVSTEARNTQRYLNVNWLCARTSCSHLVCMDRTNAGMGFIFQPALQGVRRHMLAH